MARRPTAVLEAVLYRSSVAASSGCRLWTGGATSGGYGIIWDGEKSTTVHRVAHEVWVGPIPDGWEVDHVRARGCTSTLCIEPAHLEAVTRRENMRRQAGFLEHDDDQRVAATVLALRAEGFTFTEVAAAAGISRSRAHRLATGQWQRTEEVI